MLSKQKIRQQMLFQRQKLSMEERENACRMWTQLALDHLAAKRYGTIAGYMPIRGELDVMPLLSRLQEAGKILLLPRTPKNPAPLTFHHYTPDHVEKGKYGITQPTAQCEVMQPDVVLVPLVAYDKLGNRLGYGGGYYDRTLAELTPQPHTIGCAYAFQKLKKLQAETHDICLDIILDEKGS